MPFRAWRVIFAGLTLLALTLSAFFWAKSRGTYDELSRPILYLLNRPLRGRRVWAIGTGLPDTRGHSFWQLLFTHARAFQPLFETEAIPLWIWPRLLLGGLGFFLVIETEKPIIRATESRRQPIGGLLPERCVERLVPSHLAPGTRPGCRRDLCQVFLAI